MPTEPTFVPVGILVQYILRFGPGPVPNPARGIDIRPTQVECHLVRSRSIGVRRSDRRGTGRIAMGDLEIDSRISDSFDVLEHTP